MNAEQRAQYERDGYTVLRSFFDLEELERWRSRFQAIVEQRASRPENMLVMKDVMIAKRVVTPASAEASIQKLQDLHEDPVFDTYIRHERLLNEVEEITGPDIKMVHNMFINKPPVVDGRHPLHQDLVYFPFRPADKIVATWTAIDRCTPENGCLTVVPGTHTGEMLDHELPEWEYVNFSYLGAQGVGRETERVHLEMEPGDLALFHPVLIHGSGHNRTTGFRKAISAHYASARCRYIPPEEDTGGVYEGVRAYNEKKGRSYVLVRGSEFEGCL